MHYTKYLRSICTLFLAAITAFSAAVTTVSAVGRPQPEYSDILVKDQKYTSAASENLPIIKALSDSYYNRKSEINVSYYKIPVQSAVSIHNMILALYPDLFFVSNRITYSSTSIRGTEYVLTFKPEYLYSKQDTDRMLKEFYAAADRFLEMAKGQLALCKDDFSKAAVLHDEIVLNNRYLVDGSSPYSLLVKNFGKCEDYTRIYAYLLGQFGIYSEIIDSDSMQHEWLKIRINNKYYHVDITWDDPSPDKPGVVFHRFFLLSDHAIKDHYGYSCVKPSADTRYDNSAFHSFSSKLCKLSSSETAFYAVNRETQKILKYNYVSGTSSTAVDLNSFSWKASTGSYWPGAYSGLDTYNGLLYYNTPDSIYSYNPSAGQSVKIAGNNFGKDFYGVRIKNGKLYGIISDNPNVSGSEKFIKTLGNTEVTPTKITLDKTSLSLGKGESYTLKASVFPSNASNKAVTWTTSNNSIVTVSSGKITARSMGTATITARTVNGKTASCKVTVKNAPSKVTVSKTVLSLGVGETYKLSASIPGGTAAAVRTFRTSSSSIIKMTKTKWKGQFTAVKPGTAWVTVRLYNGKEASCKITVKAAPRSVSVNPKSLNLKVGQTAGISAVLPGGTASASRTFRSSNSSIIKMTKTSWTGKFKAMKKGTAWVTVRLYNGKEASCKVIVR